MKKSDKEKICLEIMKIFGPKAKDEDVMHVLMALLIGKVVYFSSTKDDAIKKVADISAQALIMIDSFQGTSICHWREDGESVQ